MCCKLFVSFTVVIVGAEKASILADKVSTILKFGGRHCKNSYLSKALYKIAARPLCLRKKAAIVFTALKQIFMETCFFSFLCG